MKSEVDKCFRSWWPRLILQQRSGVNPWFGLSAGHQRQQAQTPPIGSRPTSNALAEGKLPQQVSHSGI